MDILTTITDHNLHPIYTYYNLKYTGDTTDVLPLTSYIYMYYNVEKLYANLLYEPYILYIYMYYNFDRYIANCIANGLTSYIYTCIITLRPPCMIT